MFLLVHLSFLERLLIAAMGPKYLRILENFIALKDTHSHVIHRTLQLLPQCIVLKLK